MEPWTAIEQVDEWSLDVWNRRYGWIGLLPSVRFHDQDRDGANLFTEVPFLELNGTPLDWTAEVVSLSNGQATIVGGSYYGWFNATLDYDGFAWVSLSLRPGIAVDYLRLVLPFAAEYAQIVGDPDVPFEYESQPSRDQQGLAWRFGTSHVGEAAKQEPCFWVGNTSGHGAAIMFPSDANFHYNRGPNTDHQVFMADGDGVECRLTIDIITRPIELPPNVRYEFGFCATPVRPKPKDWRTVKFGNWGDGQNGMQITSGWGNGPFWEEPGSSPPPERTWNKRDRERYGRLIGSTSQIACYHSIQDISKHVAKNHPEWARTEGGNQKRGALWAVCCAPSTGYADWMLNDLDRQFRDFKWLTHCYLDNDMLRTCDNPAHGHGAFKDAFGNEIKWPWRILEHRSLHKRILGVCRKHGKQLVTHCHDRVWPGVQTWTDWICPGEDFKIPLDKGMRYDQAKDYMASHHRYGAGPVFLPALTRHGRRTSEAEVRELLGILGVYDIPIYMAQMKWHEHIAIEHQQKLHQWGVNEAEFQNFSLLTLGNWYKGKRQLLLFYNDTNKHIQERRGHVHVEIPPHDFRMISLDYKEH